MNYEKTLSKIMKSKTITEFKKNFRIFPCKECNLSKEIKKEYPTVSRGNEQAKILLIGEAPGFHEMKSGIPFVGRSGKLIDHLFNEIGIQINKHIYVSNICRCRPSNNRKPKSNEAKKCMDYLSKEISLINPKLVLTMGITSSKYILGNKITNKGMAAIVGQFFIINKNKTVIKVFVLYHPAALLYNPNLKPIMQKHLNLLQPELNILIQKNN